MKVKNTVCEKCGQSIRNNNFARHVRSCIGIKPAKKIRGVDYDPNAGYAEGTRHAWNKDKTKANDLRVFKYAESIKSSYIGSPRYGFCSAEYLNSPTHKASSSRGGGYRDNAGRSKKFKVIDSFGKETTLQSSYELEVAQMLDSLGIKWYRPKALKYNGRNYFADFYLPDFDLWLDPKNDYKAKLDEEKIRLVCEQNNVRVLVVLKHQINKEYFARLTEMD